MKTGTLMLEAFETLDREMKTWSIEYSQNGWEYTGVLIIKANDVKLNYIPMNMG